MKRSWVEVSRSRLQENVEAIRTRLSPSTRIIAVVKANAYGHGIQHVSKGLTDCGIHDFTVATLEEGVELREYVPKGKILVLHGCLKGEEKTFREHDLTAALFDDRTPPNDVKVEVKIDTGMTRLGVPWQEAKALVKGLNAQVTGLFSHFASSDQDPDFTQLQLKRFQEATSDLPYPRHISNSAGLQFPEAQLDAVRLGLMPVSHRALDLVRPILQWKTRTLTIRQVPKGEPIATMGNSSPSETVTSVFCRWLPDGYNRLLSNRSQVKIRGEVVPVLGQISMDLIKI